MENEELIFKITKEWVQEESNYLIGRDLSDDELDTTKKCIEWGLLTDIDTVIKTAINESVRINKN